MKFFGGMPSYGLIVAVLMTCNLSEAQDTFRFRLGGNWTEIGDELDPASPGWRLNPNSEATELPGLGDEARINWGGSTVTVDSAVPELNRILIGVNEDGILDVNNGGVLTTTEDIVVGNNDIVDGTMNVNSGAEVNVGRILWVTRGDANGAIDDTFGFLDINAGGVVNVASHLWWGVRGPATVNISGTLNQTGGILGLGTFNALDPSGGAATVNVLSGGEFNLNNISGNPGTPSIQPGSSVNISGTGRMTLPNDLVGNVMAYVDAGLITGNGVAGAVDVSLEFVGGLSGDFNEDGVVDAADYTVYRDNVGDIAGLPNDDGLGVVGQLHYNLWENQFGATAAVQTVVTAAVPAAAAVPEPGSLLMVTLLAIQGLSRVRR